VAIVGIGAARRGWVVLAVIAVGVLLRLPALDAGLSMDDYAHRAMVAGTYPVPRAWWDALAFSHGDPAEVKALQDAGFLPWWSDPGLRIAPLRPLASALLWVDVRLLGDDPVLGHVHSLVWLASMFAAAWLVLARMLPPAVAIVALGLYALDDSHAFGVAWLANRSVLVVATFAFLSVAAHLHARELGWAPGRWLAPVCLGLALAAGEYGLGAIGCLVAYEALGRSDARRDRVRALVPALAILVAYAIVYAIADAGGRGSSLYIDPVREPIAALRALAERLPILLGNLVLALPTGELSITEQGRHVQAWVGGAAFLAIALWCLRPVGLRPGTVEHPRWWVAAAFLATLPQISAFPSARLLVVPSLAMAVVLARLLVIATTRAWHGDRTLARASWGIVAATLAVLHGGLAPWWAQRELASIGAFGRAAQAAVHTLPLPADASAGDLSVVVLSSADPMTLLYPPLMRDAEGLERPHRWWVLSGTPGPHELVREDARTLVLVAQRGPMLRTQVEQVFRRAPPGFAVGDRVALDGMTVEVVSADDGGFPSSIRVRFDRDLDDPSLRFVVASPRGYLRYPLGPVGVRVLLPAAVLPAPGDAAAARP
jgi:hypothetical protein